MSILIIARDNKSLTLDQFYKYYKKYGKNIDFFTNDLDLIQNIKLKFDIRPQFLDETKNYLSISDNFVSIVDNINKLILEYIKTNAFLKKYPQSIFLFVKQAEGGDTSQRIQDILLLSDRYNEILKNKTYSKIIFFESNTYYWENTLFYSIAHKLGIRIQIKYRYILSYISSKLIYKNISYLKQLYFSIFTIRHILASYNFDFKKKIPNKQFLLIQLCSSAEKHKIPVLELVRYVRKNKLNELILTWRVDKIEDNFQNLNIIILEKLLTIKDVFYAGFISIYLNIKIRYILGICKKNNSTLFNSFDTFFLQKIVSSHLINDVSDNIRHYKAISKLSPFVNPKYVKPWTRILSQAVVLKEAFSNNKLIKYIWQPSTDYLYPNPYLFYALDVSFIFASSKGHKRYLVDNGSIENQIFLSGNPWDKRIIKFINKYTKIDSLKYFGIESENYEKIVLLDASYVSIGYFSYYEQITYLNLYLEIANINKNIFFLIKPHIGYRGNYIERIVANKGYKNVKIVSKDEMPYHALNCVDILITKTSILALEAMVFKVPTVSLLLDKDDRFKIYGNSCEYFYEVKTLKNFLISILTDNKKYEDWFANIRENQIKFLNDHLCSINMNPSEFIIKTLINKS